MSLRTWLGIAGAATVLVSTAYPVIASKEGAVENIQLSTRFLKTAMENSKTAIPASVLKSSYAIAIIPNVVKVGFVVAGSRGKGVLLQRRANNTWSNPAFVTLTSGSVGFQVGGQSSDIILVFRNQQSVDTVLTEDFTVGGNVTATAGPAGTEVVSPNDDQPKTDIFTYVMSEGLFAGVSAEGSKVAVDKSRNADYYGQKSITVQQIFKAEQLPVGSEVKELHQALASAVSGSK
jgi:SH3 domain-containing YSC84-like protein 1